MLLVRKSPEILTGIGVAGFVTTTVLAVKATPKALMLIEEEKRKQNRKIMDDAIKNGGLSLFEGKIEFEKEDLEELKSLLRYNLPIQDVPNSYEVLTEEPISQGEDAEDK